MNISLAIKELLKGTMDYLMLACILGSTFVVAAAMLAFTTWWFGREKVLFRE
jgi:sodium transport system permease protein